MSIMEADVVQPMIQTPTPVVGWSGLKSRFIAAKDAVEQARIFGLSTQIVQRIEQWATRQQMVHPMYIDTTAITFAAAAPFANIEALCSAVRFTVWEFMLDDLFDSLHLSRTELRQRVAYYCTIAQQGLMSSSNDKLATFLGEVRCELAGYPLFNTLGRKWAKALCRTIEGMMCEYEWRQRYQREGALALPAYAEYLAIGRYSLAYPPNLWTTLITIGDPSTVLHLPHLHTMVEAASTCVRLANDLGTYRRETDEGTINALVILRQALLHEGLPMAEAQRQAEERMRAEIVYGLDRLAQLQTAANRQAEQPAVVITDMTRFICDFYTQYDYRTLNMKPQGG